MNEMPTTDGKGIYLYCFARAGKVRDISAVGVDGRNGVIAKEAGGVAAVSSPVLLDDFCGESADANMKDPAWVIPRACRHEHVIEEVMSRSSVLPVRFGAVFSSSEALRQLLEQECEGICRFLDWVRDKEEWCLKGFVYADRAREWLMASDPALADQRAQMPESPGARYFQQKRLLADARLQSREWAHAVAQQVEAELKELVLEFRPLRLQQRDLSGTDAEMVWNWALLLPRERVADLRRRAGEIGARYAEQGLTLDVSGPWPPYNFSPSFRDEQG
jgi:hypothetical protein